MRNAGNTEVNITKLAERWDDRQAGASITQGFRLAGPTIGSEWHLPGGISHQEVILLEHQ